MELQLQQKEPPLEHREPPEACQEQESEHLAAQLRSAREVPQVEAQRSEAAKATERAGAVAQAKELAEAHVQLKQLQESQAKSAKVSRAQQEPRIGGWGWWQEEMMQLRGELRRLEEVAGDEWRLLKDRGSSSVKHPNAI